MKLIYYPIITFVCFELALLILGYRPYNYDHYKIKTNPSSAFVGDSSYGIKLNPGNYKISLNDSIEFKSTHCKNGRRETVHPSLNRKKRIAFLGCSFTYGYGVDNNKNFVQKLQNLDTTHIYENFGVIGYGTVQSYLQLKNEIIPNSENYEAILLNFSAVHLSRNVLSPYFRKNLKLGFGKANPEINQNMKNARFPYIDENVHSIEYETWANLHQNWLFREYLASVNWLQTLWEKSSTNVNREIELTELLIKEMNELCYENNIKFGLVLLDELNNDRVLSHPVPNFVRVDFDFESTTLTHYPVDSHPNESGHEHIATILSPFIQKILAE